MKFSTIEQALEWVSCQTSQSPFASLEKVKVALDYLGNPHHDLPVIHITGTNGKGSTTAFLRDLLQSQGLKVGTFTSPHIMKFNERIGFDGANISDEDLLLVINKMWEVNEYLGQSPYGRLVFFELYTVMGAYYFYLKQPDVCLIEVGIGGYSDATNVYKGQLAIITTIGLDHGDKLGSTVEAIAYEKSGIIKEDAKVVTGNLPESCLAIMEMKAGLENAQLHIYDQDYKVHYVKKCQEAGSAFMWSNQTYENIQVAISMIGSHQVHNACVAIQAFSLWMDQVIGQVIQWQPALEAIHKTSWLARMESIHQKPLIYIDGAHNVAGLKALNRMMQEYFKDYSYTIIYAGLSTKNQAEQLPYLLEFGAQDTFLTEFEHMKAMTADDYDHLEDEEDFVLPQMVDWRTYIKEYLANYQGDDKHLLLLTGSLYFVSEVREFVVNHTK